MLTNEAKANAIRLAEQHEARLKLSLLEWEKVWHRDNAKALRELVAEIEENDGVTAVWRGRTQRAEAERDAARAEAQRMLEALEYWVSDHEPRDLGEWLAEGCKISRAAQEAQR